MLSLRPVLIGSFWLCALIGCTNDELAPLDGRPHDPYQLTLTLEPERPTAGQEVLLEFQLRYRKSAKPIGDLQIAHERLVHNFITHLDFSSFAHIHHEDFSTLSELDRATGKLRFPYTFPTSGRYRIVSEFAHRNRNWVKHFDVSVHGPEPQQGSSNTLPALQLVDIVDGIEARLNFASQPIRAGVEMALEASFTRNGEPVTDLQLHLGTEMHGAIWRQDGKHFGHLHSYTPKVAALLQQAHDESVAPTERGARIQEMMVQLMCLDAELVFPGPSIPIRYVFPADGRYVMFLQVSPQGVPKVFRFIVNVIGDSVTAGTTGRSDD